MSSVEEYDSVVARSKKEGQRYHFGFLAQICHEKHSELEASKRKYKARVVFRGDQVKNEEGLQAVFQEQSSSACLISGIKTLDIVARLPGNDGQERDGQQAYIQAQLGGAPTYVHLPPDQWPKEWRHSFRRPVVRLRLALYGHPMAGLYWEQHAAAAIEKCGFEKIADWECMYFHNHSASCLESMLTTSNSLVAKNLCRKVGPCLRRRSSSTRSHRFQNFSVASRPKLLKNSTASTSLLRSCPSTGPQTRKMV